MFYDAVKNDHGLPVDPFKAIVAPRPIAWVSTLSPEGVANLAPYSFFNAFSQSPHYVAFGSGAGKDSMRNIEATGEFVVNLATFDLREQMNASSAHVAADEFELAGLAKAPCRIVHPPRVAESPAALECCLHRIVALPDDDGQSENFLIIGRVLGIYIDDRFIHEGRVDTAAMRPIARMGYSEYATVTEAWRMRRPD
ncbi:flavin reductase family protein [Aestuariivirga sp.]|uniref:flavin reductase family protein n=1 Tax=Aestuariivirga sp. TaxID=2650926 RepID=UPI00301A9EC6